MDLAFDVLTNILAGVVGVAGVRLKDRVLDVRPARRAWRILDPQRLVICAASSTSTNTGEYFRPATGIGQVRALAILVSALQRAYGNVSIPNIFLATDQLHGQLESDLLLLGGPKNNRLSARFLDLINDRQPAVQIGGKILWRKITEGRCLDDGEEFSSTLDSGKVIRDYGLVVRAQSPFTTERRSVVLISGTHTYGVVAAARYFAESLPRRFAHLRGSPDRNLAALVSAEVVDDYPTGVRLERFHQW